MGPADAIAIELARPETGYIAVPDEVGPLAQLQGLPRDGGRRMIEEAQLHAVGVLAEEGEVDPGAAPGRAQRIRLARPDATGHA
jgi:hypothetical protein